MLYSFPALTVPLNTQAEPCQHRVYCTGRPTLHSLEGTTRVSPGPERENSGALRYICMFAIAAEKRYVWELLKMQLALLLPQTLKEEKNLPLLDFLSVCPSYVGCVLEGRDLSQCLATPEIKDLALQLICKYRIMSFENSSLVWVCSQNKFCSLCILGQHKWQMSQSLFQSLLFWTHRRIIRLDCLCSSEIN